MFKTLMGAVGKDAVDIRVVSLLSKKAVDVFNYTMKHPKQVAASLEAEASVEAGEET